MKNLAKLIKLTLISTLIVTMFSCSDDIIVEPANNSITAVASRTPEFTTFVSALDLTGLLQTLDQNGPLTVFAPTNDAFATFLTANNFSSLEEVPASELKQILLNHVISGKNLATNLTTGYIKTYAVGTASTTNKLDLYIDTSNGLLINGVATVTVADILATNGVIHQVDNVIGLPTIATFVTADSNFSTLAGLLTELNLVPNLQGDDGSPFTVFAPSDVAYTTFEMENPGVLIGLTSEQKTAVLTYHLVSGENILSTAFPADPITTFETGELSITGTVITDEQDRQTNLIPALLDIQASNGVVHVIDNVLLPILN